MYITNRARQEFLENMGSKWWRMNNLYWIVDKRGNKVLLKANPQQKILHHNQHTLNLILKARQLGMTTWAAIDLLDECLFIPNQTAGFIAHTKQDAAKIFRTKVQYAYRNLPPLVQKMRPTTTNEKGSMVFDHGEGKESSFYVGNSMRSASITQLHISEFGKICAKEPAKAEEIVTGALQAVGVGQRITIESTAEGQSGYFYEYCVGALDAQRRGLKLTEMDWKFFFFPWWDDPQYRLKDWQGVIIPLDMERYFERLEKDHNIKLSPAQCAWYVKKLEQISKQRSGDDDEHSRGASRGNWDKMKQEFPSYPEEAFSRTVEGAYYAAEFAMLQRNQRIGKVPFSPYHRVDTWWDLGMTDSTAIWFTQTIGQAIHIIDYYESSGNGLPHYIGVLRQKQEENGYQYGRMVAPHDIEVREISHGLSRKEMARQQGVNFEVAARGSLQEGIERVRMTLPLCWFDERNCARGIKALQSYQRDWDEGRGDWKDNPKRNWATHGADAFRTLAAKHTFDWSGNSSTPDVPDVSAGAWS